VILIFVVPLLLGVATIPLFVTRFPPLLTIQVILLLLAFLKTITK